MLYHHKDWKSAAYLTALPILVIYQWREGFNPWLYVPTLLLSIGTASINHNHGHIPLWKNSFLNSVTDYWICLLQGVPVFLFEAAHIKSHHRYNQGEKDVTRVTRVGNHNHLLGYLIFPVFVLSPINKLRSDFLNQVKKEDFPKFLRILGQYHILLVLWAGTLWLDWQKALLFVIFPQFISVHFLLASNYLQHAQAEVGSEFNHSRNFTGIMNTLYFNVGYHTAHHEQPQIHWTKLPSAHESIASKIDPRLNEKSLVLYFIKTMSYLPLKEKVRSLF